MKKIISAAFAAGVTAGLIAVPVSADNPIVQTRFTADPAPMVSSDGETLYLFTSHDEPEGGENGVMYVMNDWNLYSTKDMVNWTDLGVPAGYKVFKWAKGDAWAIQTVERNGKYYLYAPLTGQNTTAIGVAVADRPEGPYVDAIGEPLIEGFGYIDPSVFVDGDNAYIVWGNPQPYYAELNEDMISFKTEPVQIEKTAEAFGTADEGKDRDTRYEEGPWIFKRGDKWYLSYAGNGIPEDLEYSMSDSPAGPWTYKGVVMRTFDSGTFTNHPGYADYKGHSYLFYHGAKLPGANGFRRSVAVEEFEYNPDGSIPEVTPTSAGPQALGTLDPYARTEAETIAFSSGLETDEYYTNTETGEETETFTNADTKNVYVKSIGAGDYIKVANVDFGDTGAGMFTAAAACDKNGGEIELHLDSADGEIIGVLPVSYTAGKWQEKTCAVSNASGVHDLYFVFKGESRVEDLFRLDYWRFTEKTQDKTLKAINAVTADSKIDIKDGVNTTALLVKAIYGNGIEEDVTNDVTAVSDNISFADGIITGTSYGEAVITVTYNGVSENINLNVKDMDTEITAKSISVAPKAVKLVYGGSGMDISAEVTYEDGHTEDVTEKASYTVADTSVAGIDGYRITPKKVGATALTASFTGKLGGAVSVTVPVTVTNNIAQNGDFESDTAGWSISGGGDWIADKSGKMGAAHVPEGAAAGVRSISQDITKSIDLTPGKEYTFSADIYYDKTGDESNASFNIWLLTNWEAADGNQISGAYGNASVVPGEWTTVNITLPITDIESLLNRGADYTALVIESGDEYTNDFYVDNIAFAAAGAQEPPEDKLTTQTTAERIDNCIVLTSTASGIITDSVLHIALYDENGTLVRYMKVPTSASEKTAYVVFEDNTAAKYAKVYVWDSIEGMMPAADAETVEIR